MSDSCFRVIVVVLYDAINIICPRISMLFVHPLVYDVYQLRVLPDI